jgi:hypothetical protein
LPEADNQLATQVNYNQAGQTYALGANVQAAIYAIDDELIAQDARLDVIEGNDQTVGSIEKALKDAKDYADGIADAQNEADEITYDQSGQTYALGADVQAAIYAIDDELIAQDGRLDTLEGDANTAGSVAKALQDAKDYADAQDALQDAADEISYSDASQTYALGSTVQAAIYAIDDELIAQDGRLDTIEGDANTVGSIAKAEADAKAYADAQIDAAKLALGTNYSVADIAARDALEDLTVGDIIFVADDGDGKWAQYKVTVADPIAYEKIMDEDVYLNAISASAVKSSYESNADTNAFTDALLNKLNAIEDSAKDDQSAAEVPYSNSSSGLTATDVQNAIDEIEGRIGVIEDDEDTEGSIAKALKDAKAYADQQDALQDAANEITYDQTGQTYALGADVQAAIYAIDDELIVQDGRLDGAESDISSAEGRLDTIENKLSGIEDNAKDDQSAAEVPYDNTDSGLVAGNVKSAIDELDGRLDTVEGDANTAGSIAKALQDAKDYADTVAAGQDAANEISYSNATSGLIAVDVQEAIDEIDGDLDSHIADSTIHFTQAAISITESQISDFGTYEPADATILKAGDIGVTVQAYDANILVSGDIGVTVQGYDADTVVDANYETFDSTATYANLRAQATTAEDVGLGNVTNESKTTMFDDPTFTGIVTVPDPVNSTDATNKRYVDEIAEGIRTAPAVHAATTTNLSGTYDNGTLGVGATLNLGTAATLTIDGESVWELYDGLLVKDQTNKEEHGRYVLTQIGDGSTDWIFTRCGICDEADEIPGRYVFVKDGTVNQGTGWVQIVADPDTFVVGTDDIEVYQFSGAGTYTAGSGLTLTGNEFALSGDSFDEDGTFASLRAQATTKEDVGLTNVTDNEQVKAAASSTDGHIPKWSGTDGDAIVDGYGVQTTLSSSTTELVRADAIVTALLDKADKLASIVEKTATFTVDTTEANKVVVINTASNITITLPTDAANANLPVGTQIAFIRNGSGTVTFASSATILSDASKKSIKAQYTSAAVVKIAADTWQLVGNLAA